MGKTRMLELAKQSKQKVADLVNLAKNLNVEVKNAMSSVSDDDAQKILANIGKIQEQKTEKKAAVKKTIEKDVDAVAAPVAKTAEKAPVEAATSAPVIKEEAAKVAVAKEETKTEAPAFEIGKNASNRPERRTQTREYDNRGQGQNRGGYENRNQGQGGQNRDNRNQGQGGQNRDNRDNRNFDNRGQGQNRGGYENRNQQGGGGYNRNQGQGGQNRDNRNFDNRGQGQNRGGYENRNQQGGGYNRNQGQGGQNRDNRNFNNSGQGQNRGGYDNRNQQGGGGYNRNQGQGGQNRDNRNFDNRGQGQNRGGYDNRNQQGGGYNRNQGQGGQNRGGYNRNSGMDNRNIDRKLNDIQASTVTPDVTKPTRNYNENKDRRYQNEPRKSKKQLLEERRLEERNMAARNKSQKEAAQKAEGPKVIKHKGTLTVGELSQQMGVTVAEIIKYLLGLGIMATINHSLDSDAIELIASEYQAEVQYEEVIDESDLSVFFAVEDDEKNLVSRPPVVTIMGHVDHGKTTLLDTIRKAKVAEGESGGITQHIGAYQISHEGKKLTFLDTPGHEAFTSMRARGASITDIAIIVVAADDGVMPQTKEAVQHAKAAEVPIIVAVNKIDKPGANPQHVMQGLTELGLQPEAWGGDTIFVEISAKMGTNIEELLEMILLVAEIQELKANPNRPAFGTVIEARLDKGRGAVATLLVQGGTLTVGDPIVVGNTYGRVRTMENDKGKRLKSATPSTPVELTGLMDVPSAGDQFAVFESEKKARQIGEQRAAILQTEARRKSSAMNLEDLNRQILEGEVKDINVIVKGDVQGSVEAVAQAFGKIDVQGVRVKIIREAVGGITESDVMLALATNAIIYGFNVRPDANSRQVAETEGVTIRLHSIIYKAIEELELAMTGMLDPEFEEVITGQVEIRQLFKVSKIGTIAGCMVTNGEIKRDSLIRIIRDNVQIYEGKLGSLKRGQDDVKSVNQGYECGLTIDGYNDLKEGDVVEAYEMREIKRG